MFAVCCGVETAEMFHCASTSPTSSSFCLRNAVSTSQGRIRRGKKNKKKSFSFSFHQQFMMERCSTYSPHQPPTPPSERWLHSIEASLLRCPQSRCRLKPRFPSTWELEIEGMIGSHLVISCSAGLTARSLSCMTNEHNISTDTPRAV